MLVFFHLPYCYRCKEMKSRVYKKADIIDLVNERFIPVMVDVGKDKKIVESFGVKFVPTHIFIIPDGTQVLRKKDVISKARFQKMLLFISDQKYKNMDFDSYEKSGA